MCDDKTYDFWEHEDSTEFYSEAIHGVSAQTNNPVHQSGLTPIENALADVEPVPWAEVSKPVTRSRRSMHFVEPGPSWSKHL